MSVPKVLEGVDASAFASSSVRTVAYTSENVPSPATTLKFCSRHSAASAIPYVADPSSRLSNTLYELNKTRRQSNCPYENKSKTKRTNKAPTVLLPPPDGPTSAKVSPGTR